MFWGLALCWEVLWFWIAFEISAWDLGGFVFWVVFGISTWDLGGALCIAVFEGLIY